jgi:hypothetical protein
MRKFILTLLLAAAVAMPASAQSINLDFPGLAEKADEMVDITLDSTMLKLASKFLSSTDHEEGAVRDMIQGLKGIYVRSYSFDKDNAYDRSVIDKVRGQLGSNWKPLVTVRSKTRDNVNIFADMAGEKIVGLVIISADPQEFTVVNIVGPVDIEKLASLQGEFGIPHFTKGEDHE